MDTIETNLDAFIEQNKAPSVAYIYFTADSIKHEYYKGFSDVGKQKQITEHTLYKAFSTTKTFTALAILQLAEKGMLDVNQPAASYLPEFPFYKEITVKQLLSHSSGIPNPMPLKWIHLQNEHHHFNERDFFAPIIHDNTTLKFQPNEKFRYSNLGYLILGQIIEEVSGTKYEDYIQQNIIKPIDIQSDELTYYPEKTVEQAKGYQKKYSGINFLLNFLIDKKKFMGKPEGDWKPFQPFYVNGAAYGGVISSPKALAKYIQSLLHSDSPLLSNEYKALLFTENVLSNQKYSGMCLSWFKGNLNGNIYYTHAGGGGGYYCEIRIYPTLGTGSVIMMNRSGLTDERILDKLDKYFVD